MSKKSPLIAATAPTSLAMSVTVAREATIPESSRVTRTPGRVRSTSTTSPSTGRPPAFAVNSRCVTPSCSAGAAAVGTASAAEATSPAIPMVTIRRTAARVNTRTPRQV
jgi:hypothetical protein